MTIAEVVLEVGSSAVLVSEACDRSSVEIVGGADRVPENVGSAGLVSAVIGGIVLISIRGGCCSRATGSNGFRIKKLIFGSCVVVGVFRNW